MTHARSDRSVSREPVGRGVGMGAVLVLLAVQLIASTAAAQRWPRFEPEAAAHARRDADFARATGLTLDQARTVFAQMQYPPHAPRARAVVDETRGDGSRNVFALLDFDPITECRIEGGTVRECRARPQPLDVQSHIVLVQTDASGRVARTAVDLVFGIPARTGALRRPATLRLFAPAPGAASVAVVEGSLFTPASRDEYGGLVPAEYQHSLYVWDGRRGSTYPVSALSDRGNLGAVVVDTAGPRLVRRQVVCGGACPCRLPATLEAESAQLARFPATCTPTEQPIDLPPELRLIDDDLEARTPRLTREERLAERVPALVRSSGLSQTQAESVVSAHSTFDAPRFGRFVGHTAADGSRELYGVVETSAFESCVYGPRWRSLYDAVRGCAHESRTRGELLYVRLDPNGGIAESRLLYVGIHGVAELHLGRDANGVFAAALAVSVSDHPGGRMAVHEASFARRGRPAGVQILTFISEHSRSRDATQSYAGDVLVRPSEPPFVALTQRRVACTERCPCTALPTDLAEAHTIVEGRIAAEDPTCRPVESPLAPSR